jgi:hypothetical protein
MWYLWENGDKERSEASVSKLMRGIIFPSLAGLFFYLISGGYGTEGNMTSDQFKGLGLIFLAYMSWGLSALLFFVLLLVLLSNFTKYKR